jgi:DNA-binding XRE family transcriptional regulator
MTEAQESKIGRYRRISRYLLQEAATKSPLSITEARMAMASMTGTTHSDLARHVGASRQTLTMVMTGRGRSDRIERKLAKLFGVPHSLMFPEPRQRAPNKSNGLKDAMEQELTSAIRVDPAAAWEAEIETALPRPSNYGKGPTRY